MSRLQHAIIAAWCFVSLLDFTFPPFRCTFINLTIPPPGLFLGIEKNPLASFALMLRAHLYVPHLNQPICFQRRSSPLPSFSVLFPQHP